MDTTDWVAIPYDAGTYKARFKLREMGCEPDRLNKRWLCPPAVAREAKKLAFLNGIDESLLDDACRAVFDAMIDAMIDGRPYPGE